MCVCVCSLLIAVCVCVLGWVKYRAQIPSMGHYLIFIHVLIFLVKCMKVNIAYMYAMNNYIVNIHSAYKWKLYELVYSG